METEPLPALDMRRLAKRRALLLAVAVAVLVAEIRWPVATWPERLIEPAFYLYKLGWLAVCALAVVFWLELYRVAEKAGGPGYATGHVFLAALLTPGVIGLFLVPRLVERDATTGFAAWRRRHALAPRERVLRTALYVAALVVVAGPLWLLGREFLYGAPVLAFFLQRLVLPWCRPRADRSM